MEINRDIVHYVTISVGTLYCATMAIGAISRAYYETRDRKLLQQEKQPLNSRNLAQDLCSRVVDIKK